MCNQCLSSLTVWVRIPLMRGVLDTTVCDKVCQWFAAGRWHSPSIPISFTNETDHHDITEILLKVALHTITQTLTFFSDLSLFDLPSFIQKLFGMNHNHTKRCIQWYLINWGISTTRVWKIQIRIRIESKAIQASRKSLDIVHYTIGASWGPWWSHVCWIYNCLCIQYISPLKLWIWISLRRGVLDKTLCDKISRWLATDPFSLGTPVFSNNIIDNHDIAEILLKVALNTITLTF